jgi:hypothetical protein
LLFTLREGARALKGTTRIGRIVRGAPGQIHFQRRTLEPRGYDHFRRDS